MKHYNNPYDIIKAINPVALKSLSDDEIITLQHICDFEPYYFIVNHAKQEIKQIDSFNDDLLSVNSFSDFLSETINYIKDDC